MPGQIICYIDAKPIAGNHGKPERPWKEIVEWGFSLLDELRVEWDFFTPRTVIVKRPVNRQPDFRMRDP